MTFSPDGRVLASAGKDRLVKLWDVATGQELHSLDGQAAVSVVAFSPDGNTLASGAIGQRVMLWHVPTGKKLLELDLVLGLDGPLQFVDNHRLAFRRFDHALCVLDLRKADAGPRRYPGQYNSDRWTWSRLPKPSARAMFSRPGKHEVNVDKPGVPCELLSVSQGEVRFWLANDCLVRSAGSVVIDVSQPGPLGDGAILRIEGPKKLVTSGFAMIANQATSAGTMVVGPAPAFDSDSAGWTHEGVLKVAHAGIGTIRVEQGGRVSSGACNIGELHGSRGVAIVRGEGSQWSTGSGHLEIGRHGNGTLIVEQGGLVSAHSGELGAAPTSHGVATITGRGSRWAMADNLAIGWMGTGVMNVLNGGVVTNQNAWMSSNGQGTAIVSGEGSQWNILRDLHLASFQTSKPVPGTIKVSDGGLISVKGNAFFKALASATAEKGGALEIGGDLDNNGSLDLRQGGTLSNGDGSICGGRVSVYDVGSEWNSAGSLYVGGRAGGPTGRALLQVWDSGRITVKKDLRVWPDGDVHTDSLLAVDRTLINEGLIKIHEKLSAQSISNSGKIVNVGELSGKLVNLAGGILIGNGLFKGLVTLDEGSLLAPGDGLGETRGTDFVFGPGSKLLFEINDAAGVAKTHWDLLSLSDTLMITAIAENPFVIELVSLDDHHTAGQAANFDSNRPYSWHILNADGGISGFSSDKVTISATNFRNPLSGGQFSISQKDNGLFLNFTPGQRE